MTSIVVFAFQKFQNGEVNDEEEFLHALQSSLEIFVNRMKSNSQRGRSIANDSSVQTLFMAINTWHPKLMKHISEREEARSKIGVSINFHSV